MMSTSELWQFRFFLYPAVFFIGMVVASFLNVIIYRLPRGLSLAQGRSICPACGAILERFELIPFVSYVILRGKCRHCGMHISLRYPFVELLGGLLAVLALSIYGFSLAALSVYVLFCALILIAFVDLATMEIPNSLIVFLLAPAIALIFYLPGVSLFSHAAGLLAMSVPLFVTAFSSPSSFGGGDIKVMAVCGLALGWQLGLFALAIAILSGGVYGIFLLARKHVNRQYHFAFAPFLALGVTLSLLFHEEIMYLYATAFR